MQTVPKTSDDPYTKQNHCYRKFYLTDRECFAEKIVQFRISFRDVKRMCKWKLIRIQKPDDEQNAAKQEYMNGSFLIV